MTVRDRLLSSYKDLSAFFAGAVSARRQLALVAAQVATKGGVRDDGEDR
ncbi:hypothetical protein [Streptomyces sp. NPDC001389]